MTLIEKQMTHPRAGWRINYFPINDASHNIADEMLVAEGWTISTQEIRIDEWDENAMCRHMEYMAYRFYEKGKETA